MKVSLSWRSIWRCTYRIWFIHFCNDGWVIEKEDEKIFQLPSFNPRQQAKLLKSSFSSIYSSFDLFYDLLKRLNPYAVEAEFAQSNIVVEEEAGAVVVPVMRNGDIFIASVYRESTYKTFIF